MSEERRTFVELALVGQATLDEIDDHVDRWHADPLSVSLQEYLGLTHAEYPLWLSSPDMLPLILIAREQGARRHAPANDDAGALRLASRATDTQKIRLLEAWLRDGQAS